MTSVDLEQLLTQTVDFLNLNKQMCTPEFLGNVQKAIDVLKGNWVYQEAVALALGVTKESLLRSIASLENGLTLENQLTSGTTTENYIKICEGLKSHPSLLFVVSKFLG